MQFVSIYILQTGRRNFFDYERKLQGIPFGEVVAFIEESFMASTKQFPAFKLSDLIKLFVARLSALGVHLEIRVHSTRFKKKIAFTISRNVCI